MRFGQPIAPVRLSQDDIEQVVAYLLELYRGWQSTWPQGAGAGT